MSLNFPLDILVLQEFLVGLELLRDDVLVLVPVGVGVGVGTALALGVELDVVPLVLKLLGVRVQDAA